MELFRVYSDKQLLIRVIVAAADAVLFYIGYLFLSRIFDSGRINIVFFILTAELGLLMNLLPYNNENKRKSMRIISSIGLAWAVVIVTITSLLHFDFVAIPMILILLVFLYYKSYRNYVFHVLYIYTLKDFYRNAFILVVLNIAVTFLPGFFGPVASEIMTFSVLYIIIVLYLMTQLKNFRCLNKNENKRKTAFEAVVTMIMIGVMVVMSIPGVLRSITHPFVAFFQFIYERLAAGILFVVDSCASFLVRTFNLTPDTGVLLMNSASQMMGDSTEKYRLEDYRSDSQVVQMFGKVLAFVLLLAICAYVIYLLYRFIDRITRSEIEEDFIEDTEFVLVKSKDKGPGLLNKLGNSLKKTVGNLSSLIRANNADKLRNEYKAFVRKLHGKKLIVHYNYTAQHIYKLMLSKAPDQEEALENITAMYEEVRYGVRYPEDTELKAFKKNLAEISKCFSS